MGFQPVGEHVLVRLDITEIARAAAPRAGDATLAVDDDALRFDEARLDERCQRKQRRRGIAGGIRDARGAADLLALAAQLGKPVGPAFREAMIATDVDESHLLAHTR